MIDNTYKLSDIERKSDLEARLCIIKEIQTDINNISYKLEKFCLNCYEDRIFCVCCAIPLTRRKIETILLRKYDNLISVFLWRKRRLNY